jgi:hypothetical protein
LADQPISRVQRYADILNPLFWNEEFNRVDRMFEWACAMVRVTGMKDTGWDSYTESIALLEDFTQLMGLELPAARFPVPANTQARLALTAYSHMIEMSSIRASCEPSAIANGYEIFHAPIGAPQ